jgi:Flp pilus assembly protein TadD
MIRSFLTTIYLSFILLLVLAVSHVNADVPNVVSEQKKTVVTVYVNDKNGKHIATGRGFIVDQNGVVVTNCQVIMKWFEEVQNRLIAVTEDGANLPIEDLISSKCKNNLALFKVEGKGLPTVKLAKDYKPGQGESIFVAGGPSEFETRVSEGVVKSVLEKGRLIQISVPVTPEMSGSPLLNSKGEAIGAVTFLPQKGKNLNFAVTLKNVAKQLAKYRKLAKIKVPSPVPPPSRKPSAVSITKAKKEVVKKPDDARAYFLHGCSYQELNMYEEAIKLYRQALKIKPDFAEVYINLGIAYYKLGKYSDSIDAYKEAIKLKPNSASLYTKLGATQIIKGRYSVACDTFKKAVNLDPNDAAAHYNLGIAYFLNGETTGAYREYLILKELDKERANSLKDLFY